MASALEKIMKGVLKKSEAEKAFSPWWESLSEKMLYGLMIMGMISLPFNMVSNTPVECTLNQYHPSFRNLSNVESRPMRYHHFYLRKFCTMNYIEDAMVFLPFVLILAPLPLVGVGQMCLRYYKVKKKMEQFYKLLLKDSMEREDVEALEKDKARNRHEILQMFRESNGIYLSYISKSVIQIVAGSLIATGLLWLQFKGLSGEEIDCLVFDKMYTCVVPLAGFYARIVASSNVCILIFIICNVYFLFWMKIPRLGKFYDFMVKSYDHVDTTIKTEHNKEAPPMFTKIVPVENSAEPFFDVFFDKKSPDLGLLINLIATVNGFAEGLRFVSLFDHDYQKLWKPIDTDIYHDEKRQVVIVEWNDAPMAQFCSHYSARACKMLIEYTLEINPNNSEAPIKNHKYRRNYNILPSSPFSPNSNTSLDDEVFQAEKKRLEGADDAVEDECDGELKAAAGGDDDDDAPIVMTPLLKRRNAKKLKPVATSEFKYKEEFHGVKIEWPKKVEKPKLVHQPFSVRTNISGSEYFKPEDLKNAKEEGDKKVESAAAAKSPVEYKVTISSEVNGRTIAQKTLKVPPPPPFMTEAVRSVLADSDGKRPRRATFVAFEDD